MKRNSRYECYGWLNAADHKDRKAHNVTVNVFAGDEAEADKKADDYFTRNFGGVEVVVSERKI